MSSQPNATLLHKVSGIGRNRLPHQNTSSRFLNAHDQALSEHVERLLDPRQLGGDRFR